MSRRRRYADGEQDELQFLKEQNKKLKREVSGLRKQISRLDLDRFESFKEALDRIDEIEMEQSARRKERQVSKDKWRCWTCDNGTLKLTVLERRDGVYYFRKCEACNKRTRLQRYTPDVE